MTRASRFSILLIGLILATFAGLSIAKAQLPPAPPTPPSCDAYRGCNPPRSTSAPVYRPRDRGPSRAERAAQKRSAEANAANRRGVDAWNRKDWATAEKYFREALALEPDDTTLRANLGRAENQLGSEAYFRGDYATAVELFKQTLSLVTDPERKFAEENLALAQALAQKEANRQREDAAAAEAMRNALSRMVDSVPSANGSGAGNRSGGNASSGSSGGLTFMGSGSSSTVPAGGSAGSSASSASTGSPGGLTFMGPDSSNTFGIKSNPSNLDLRPAPAKPSATATSAVEQASSISKSSQQAAPSDPTQPQVSPEEAKVLTNCGIDTSLCAQADHIQVPRPVQTPATADLLTHIPEAAQNNETIKDRVAWYQKYERNALETEGKLAEVQKQIDSGKGDPAILNAEKGTLTNQLNEQKKLQKMAEDEIRKQLFKDQLQWIEKPPQSAGKTAGKP